MLEESDFTDLNTCSQDEWLAVRECNTVANAQTALAANRYNLWKKLNAAKQSEQTADK